VRCASSYASSTTSAVQERDHVHDTSSAARIDDDLMAGSRVQCNGGGLYVRIAAGGGCFVARRPLPPGSSAAFPVSSLPD
jgi:hypothetical protein